MWVIGPLWCEILLAPAIGREPIGFHTIVALYSLIMERFYVDMCARTLQNNYLMS